MSQPIYSTNPEEEARLMKVRDAGNRIEEMARCRIHDEHLFHNTELLWIGEHVTRRYPIIPNLEPNEYWALIEQLAAQLKMERLKR